MDARLSERERRCLEAERKLNAELDARLARDLDRFPAAVYYIIPNELCERFCYFGIKTLLNQYLKKVFGYSAYTAKVNVHLFIGMAYMFPTVGAILSDSYLGKYHTIVYLSFAYLLGNVLLSVFSINGLLGAYGSLPYYAYLVPALLIAAGTGGIKPCVATHGGDQFLPAQAHLMDRFFSLFYVTISVGTLLAQFLTPYLKESVECFGNQCYLLAFGIPTLAFALSLAVFMLGHRHYRIVPAQREFLPWKAVKLACLASWRWLRASPPQRTEAGHWLSLAEKEYGAAFVEETRLLAKVVVMFLPLVPYWMLFSQGGTEWQNQYEKMDKHLLGFIPVPTEASSIINPVLIVVLVPALARLYSARERGGTPVAPVTRILWGFFATILAFVISTCLNYFVDMYTGNMVLRDNVVVSCEGCLNGAWQLPQWILLTLSEALLFPSGIQFAYTQVGRQLKASAFSVFLLTAAVGNHLVIVAEKLLQGVESASNRQWIYIAVVSLAFIVHLLLTKFWFVSKEDEERAGQLVVGSQETTNYA